MARRVNGLEGTDCLPIPVAVVRAVDPAGIGLFRDPRLDAVPLDDGVESADVIEVSVRNNETLRLSADCFDPLEERLRCVLESRIDQCRCVVEDEVDAISAAFGLLDREVVHVGEDFVHQSTRSSGESEINPDVGPALSAGTESPPRDHGRNGCPTWGSGPISDCKYLLHDK